MGLSIGAGGGSAYEWEDLISAWQIMEGHFHARWHHLLLRPQFIRFFLVLRSGNHSKVFNSYDVRIKRLSVFASKQERVCSCQTFIIFALLSQRGGS